MRRRREQLGAMDPKRAGGCAEAERRNIWKTSGCRRWRSSLRGKMKSSLQRMVR